MAEFKTCEDCIGFEFCEILYTENEIKDIILEGDIRNLCDDFKDKENFVEVVKCKDCLYARERYGKLECINGLSFRNTYNSPNMYCSYGERKE